MIGVDPRVRRALVLVGLAAAPAFAQSELISVEPAQRLNVGVGPILGLAYSARGDSIVVLGQSGRLVSLDAKTAALGAPRSVPGKPGVFARSRDDRWTAVSIGSDLLVLDGRNADPRRIPIGEEIRSLAFNPTGSIVAVGTRSGALALIAAGTGDIIGRLRDGHSRPVVHVGFQESGESLISVGEDRTITYWDTKRLQRLRQVTENEPRIVSAAASARGDLLFVGTEAAERTSARGSNPMRDVAYTNLVRAYDVANAAPQKAFDLNGRAPLALGVAPDCRHLLAAVRSVRGSSLVIVDVERGAQVLDLPLAERTVAAAFSPDGRTLALGNDAGELTLFRVAGVNVRPRCAADLRGTKFAITGPRTPLVKPSRRLRFAVLDLDDNGVGIGVSRAIADQLTTRLAANPGIRLVERRRIASIMQEQNLQQSGRTDPQSAVQLARILNVQKVVMGAVAKLGTTLTITVQLVDVETAAIEGLREIQCRNCELEELTDAVSELAETVVGEADPALSQLPEPPEIHFDFPRDGLEVSANSVVVRGTIRYSRPLEGIELLTNGHAQNASRLLDRAGTKMTRLSDGTGVIPFVQEIPLEEPTTLIAVRVVGADGNDEQRYVTVRHLAVAAAATAASPVAPGLLLDELTTALRNHVPAARVISLLGRFGITFDPATAEARLKESGADAAVLAAVRSARRVSAPTG